MHTASPYPHMGYNEIVYMLSYMNKMQTMLEVGTGYSTPFFAKFVNKLVAIEHDEKWSHEVQEMLKEHSPDSSYEYYHVAPNFPHSHPFAPAREGQFEDYVNKIKEFPEETFDIVLIDGRDRVKSTRAAIKSLKKGGKLFIHDYWNRRGKYGAVEKIEELRLLERNEQMASEQFTLVGFEKL